MCNTMYLSTPTDFFMTYQNYSPRNGDLLAVLGVSTNVFGLCHACSAAFVYWNVQPTRAYPADMCLRRHLAAYSRCCSPLKTFYWDTRESMLSTFTCALCALFLVLNPIGYQMPPPPLLPLTFRISLIEPGLIDFYFRFDLAQARFVFVPDII